MFADIRHRLHRREDLIHTRMESAFLTGSAFLLTLLTLMILFLGVIVIRAD